FRQVAVRAHRLVTRRGEAAALRDDGDLLAVALAAGERGFDSPFRLAEVPPDERPVDSFYLARFDLTRQLAVRFLGPGDQEEPRGSLVEPVDDARAFLAVRRRQLAVAMEEGMDQRTAPM